MKYIALLIVVTIFAVVVERAFLPGTSQQQYEAAVAYGDTLNKPTPPLPFVYDGCTLFPDQLPGLHLADACFDHDVAYWYGGTAAERKAADKRLQEEAAAQGWFGQIMQYPVYIGVQLFGDSFLTRLFNAHWGFGHR